MTHGGRVGAEELIDIPIKFIMRTTVAFVFLSEKLMISTWEEKNILSLSTPPHPPYMGSN